MKTVTIGSARRFSLDAVQEASLVAETGIRVDLLSFEAGQATEATAFAGTTIYQVLEGEAIMRFDGSRERVGSGRLVVVPAESEHRVENSGGGLMVVLRTRTD